MRFLGELPGGAAAPVGGHRVDAVVEEELLALGEDGGDLGDGTADPLAVEAGGDAGHVRQLGELRERTATEVEAVELDFTRGVGERQGHDEAAQHGRLAALRTAGDGDVAAGRREVHEERVAPLLEGLVHQADRHPQLSGARPAGRGQAAHRVDGEAAEEFVERGGVAQRRQPHPVGGRPGSAQPVQGHLHQAAALLLGLRLRFDRGRGGGAGHDVPG